MDDLGGESLLLILLPLALEVVPSAWSTPDLRVGGMGASLITLPQTMSRVSSMTGLQVEGSLLNNLKEINIFK